MSKISNATDTARSTTMECKMLANLLPDGYYVKLFIPFIPTKRHGIKVYKKIHERVPWLRQGKLCAEVFPPSLATKYDEVFIRILDKEILETMMLFAEHYNYQKVIKEFDKTEDHAENLPKV